MVQDQRGLVVIMNIDKDEITAIYKDRNKKWYKKVGSGRMSPIVKGFY